MKDLVKAVSTVKANANPKREGLKDIFGHVKTRVSSFADKLDSKNVEVKQARNEIFAASNTRLDNFEHKFDKKDIEYNDLTLELTHAKYNASLLDLDTRAIKYTMDKGINLASAVNESREYKKRLKSFIEACASKDAGKLDKALAALQLHLKTANPDHISVAEVQRVMCHSTPTQASYFKKFASLLGVVKAERSNAIPMEVMKESEIYKDFVSL